HLQKKYPHITVNYNSGAGSSVDQLLAAGIIPDLLVTYNGNFGPYRDKGLVFDMMELFKTHNVDLSRFESNYMDDVKNASPKGEIYGLPINVSYHAMYF